MASRRAIDVVASPRGLRSVYVRINDRLRPVQRLSAGIDGENFQRFSQNLHDNIRLLSSNIVAGYEFSLLRPVLAIKSTGKIRVICVPTIRDRIVQRSVLEYLSEGDKCKLKNSVSFGFLPGRGVKSAVRRAITLRAKSKWVYKTDITSFFDNIPRERLKAAIEKWVRHKSLHKILIRPLSSEISENEEVTSKRLRSHGIRTGLGVRQGMPLSPFFANLVLREFDQSVEKNKIRMVRYADDLIMFGNSRKECEDLHEYCCAELANLSLSIPPVEQGSKTFIVEPDQPADFLGVGLVRVDHGYGIRLLPNQMQNIRRTILGLADFGELTRRNITITRFSSQLDGILAGYAGAYLDIIDNSKQFEQQLSNLKSEIIRRIFQNGLGIDISKLRPDQRKFLGL